jgi:hypothetical protein
MGDFPGRQGPDLGQDDLSAGIGNRDKPTLARAHLHTLGHRNQCPRPGHGPLPTPVYIPTSGSTPLAHQGHARPR